VARPGLTKHRKFLRLARTLGNAPLALGCLELIWQQAYENGNPYLGDETDVEAAAEWPGETGILCKALLAAGGDGNHGFIDQVEDRPGHYCVHDLFDHAPRYVGQRLERELERQNKGVTLSQIRADAGRKGAAMTNAKRAANGSKRAANEQQIVATPAPAPAPAPALKTSSSEQNNRSDQASASLKKSGTTPSQEACRLAALLKAEILHNKPDYRITPAQERQWEVSADRMLRLDERKPEEVADLIRWVQHDEFWMANCLSMGTLRARFDQLQLKREHSNFSNTRTNSNGNRAEQRQQANIDAANRAANFLKRRMANGAVLGLGGSIP